MTDHYYARRPSVASSPDQYETVVRGLTVRLHTDAGVFSKRGLDYGTRLLIETAQICSTGRIADLGCGYAPVSAVLSRVYPESTWILVDVNERALELAARNLGHAASRVRIVQSDGFSNLSDVRFTDILLNPPIRAGKSVIYRLFQESKTHLLDGGALWIVMHKKHGVESAQHYLETLFDDVQRMGRDSGYQVYRCCAVVCQTQQS